LVLCAISAAFALNIATFPVNPEHVRGDHLQAIAATIFWAAAASIGILKLKRNCRTRSNGDTPKPISQIKGLSLAFRLATLAALTALIVSGARQILVTGRNNLNPDITQQSFYPIMKVADWIVAHDRPDTVIMAREPDILFHFTGRRTIWFPPISDPQVLIAGIEGHRVEEVLVVHQPKSYWLPTDEQCFDFLQKAYPDRFNLIHSTVDTRLYEIVHSSHGR
jgi:hypothetical protein